MKNTKKHYLIRVLTLVFLSLFLVSCNINTGYTEPVDVNTPEGEEKPSSEPQIALYIQGTQSMIGFVDDVAGSFYKDVVGELIGILDKYSGERNFSLNRYDFDFDVETRHYFNSFKSLKTYKDMAIANSDSNRNLSFYVPTTIDYKDEAYYNKDTGKAIKQHLNKQGDVLSIKSFYDPDVYSNIIANGGDEEPPKIEEYDLAAPTKSLLETIDYNNLNIIVTDLYELQKNASFKVLGNFLKDDRKAIGIFAIESQFNGWLLGYGPHSAPITLGAPPFGSARFDGSPLYSFERRIMIGHDSAFDRIVSAVNGTLEDENLSDYEEMADKMVLKYESETGDSVGDSIDNKVKAIEYYRIKNCQNAVKRPFYILIIGDKIDVDTVAEKMSRFIEQHNIVFDRSITDTAASNGSFVSLGIATGTQVYGVEYRRFHVSDYTTSPENRILDLSQKSLDTAGVSVFGETGYWAAQINDKKTGLSTFATRSMSPARVDISFNHYANMLFDNTLSTDIDGYEIETSVSLVESSGINVGGTVDWGDFISLNSIDRANEKFLLYLDLANVSNLKKGKYLIDVAVKPASAFEGLNAAPFDRFGVTINESDLINEIESSNLNVLRRTVGLNNLINELMPDDGRFVNVVKQFSFIIEVID